MIERDQYNRLMVLCQLFKATNGNRKVMKHLDKIAAEVGIKNGEFDKVYDFLLAEGLISPYGAGYTCLISHEGIKVVEQAIKYPHQDSTHFASLTELGISFE